MIDAVHVDEAIPETKTTGLAAIAGRSVLVGGAMLVGAGLAYAAYRVFKSADSREFAKDVHIGTSIAIDASPTELYSFWRQLSNLPLFMSNLVSVTPIDGTRSHWIAKGIGSSKVEWDAEIVNDIENELIAWRSLENSDVVNAGSVRFEKGTSGRGTVVRVTMNYNPPAGKVGDVIAHVAKASPEQLIKEDLRRLKQLIERGEVATIAGQTSGRAEEARVAEPQRPAAAEIQVIEKGRAHTN